MLSRLALTKAFPRVVAGARCASSVATPKVPPGREILVVEEGPERDLINFPRLKRPLYPGKVRFGFVPDEWFQALYPKTGVTGPYLFTGGLLTYLFSKEWLVTDHEFYLGVTAAITFTIIIKKFGPTIAAYADAGMDKEEKEMLDSYNQELQAYEQAIKDEQLLQKQLAGVVDLIADTKKENVALQLETEFRKRQMQVWSEVKKRLDYQLEVINIERRLQQKHMVDWVVTNVLKNISAKQEKETLAKCISDLKGLAVRA